MSFASLRNHALLTAAGVATAVVLPLGASTVLAPAATAVTAKTAVATAVAPPTAAQVKALAKKRAAAKKKALVAARGKKIVKVAARYKGVPYRYGGNGPRSFDCSGYTRYVVRKAAKIALPRTAAQQKYSKKVKKVKRSNRQVGDLIFFHRGGTIGHVAIYAGRGKMWTAPKPGDRVKKSSIYSSAVSYGRLR